METFDDAGAATRFTEPFYSTEVPNTMSFDGEVDFAFDYSTLGIESAPSSEGASTIGLGIQINNIDDGPIDEGESIAVSPIIESLPDDYRVIAEAFIYYGGGAGASEHATLGINSDRTAAPFNFAPQGAGTVYHFPHDSGLEDFATPDDYYRTSDGVVTGLYGDAPSLGLEDPEVLEIPFVGVDPVFDDPGYAGNRWFTVELAVVGGQVTASVEGVVIDQFDVSGQTPGDILIGGADVFNSVNTENWVIWDNIVVEEAIETLDGDYNRDDVVNAIDYVAWRDTLGQTVPNGSGADGNNDGMVGVVDYAVWRGNYGVTTAASSPQSVPEPGALLLPFVAGLGLSRPRTVNARHRS